MFKERLRTARLKHNITQQDMADLIGVTLRAYQYYESGEREPSLQILVSIAKTLSVTTDYLLCVDDFQKSHEE